MRPASTFITILFLYMAIFAQDLSHAQIQERIIQQNIDKAESFAVDLVATIKDLPVRWAARQRREIVNTIDLAASKYYVTRIEEVWASDQNGELAYSRFTYSDRKADTGPLDEPSPFDREVLTRTIGKQTLLKVGNENWTVVPKKQSRYRCDWKSNLCSMKARNWSALTKLCGSSGTEKFPIAFSRTRRNLKSLSLISTGNYWGRRAITDFEKSYGSQANQHP